MFWKRATANGALVAAIASGVLSFLARTYIPDVPFMDRVGYIFLTLVGIMVVFGLVEKKEQPGAVHLGDISFATEARFNIASGVIVAILIALYALWW